MPATVTVAATRSRLDEFSSYGAITGQLPTAPPRTITCGTSGNFGGGGQRTTTRSVNGEVRYYTNNRRRYVMGTVSKHALGVTLTQLLPADTQALAYWRRNGSIVCFRDTYGQRIFSGIAEVDRVYTPHSSAGAIVSDAQVPLEGVTMTGVLGSSTIYASLSSFTPNGTTWGLDAELD